MPDTSTSTPPADPILICLKLAILQKVRRFCITSQSRCDRSMQAMIASALGAGQKTDTPADRKALFKRAAAIIAAIERGKEYDPQLPPGDQRQVTQDTFLPLIPLSAMSREPWDELREDTETTMRKLAQQLPVFAWIQANAKGVGDLGLARLVGEAPLIGVYTTHEKLWKRMGVAVVGDERQQRKMDATEAKMHGFAPARRAELWSVCSDSMLRAQWRGGKVDEETGDISDGYPVGPYGEMYRARKAHTLERIEATDALSFKDRDKWTKKRCDSDARRVMSKEFLRDLWHVWHGLEARHPARWSEVRKDSAAA